MKSLFTLVLTCLCTAGLLYAQETVNPAFHGRLQNLLSFDVPVISVDSAADSLEEFTLLDTREWDEYQISHLPGAQHAGYRDFDLQEWKEMDTNTPILVYCSVGYRSERIGAKLKAAGYKRVYNLYGSIFEWVNQGYPIVDSSGQQTNHLHTYNRRWSRWVEDKNLILTW
jgi:rhodanese-related sulfurtransferase